MRKLLFLFLLSLPLFCVAETEKKDSDAKYLAGAVTMKDGKVSFNEEISAPGLSKEELLAWREKVNAKSKSGLSVKPNSNEIGDRQL